MAAVVPDPHPHVPAALGAAHAAEPAPLRRFWHPRYWPTWVFLGWLRLSAALPWVLVLAVHKKVLGGGLWLLLRSRRRIVLRNLEMCFPERSAQERKVLAKRHFENVGACIAEIAVVWFGSLDRFASRFKIEGLEHVAAALAGGKGAILLSGHFSTLEICAPVVKNVVPLFAFMYRPRHNPLLNEFQRRGRLLTGHVSFPNTDVRAMLKMLRHNAAVWYAPDQANSGKSGALVPFFGVPAMTNTATSRIARASGAAVVPFFFRRLDDDSSYLLRFEAPLADFPSGDATHDAERLNKILERFIRECPDQYFWFHRKFRGRPADLPEAYDRADVAPAAASVATRKSRGLSPALAIAAVAAFIVGFDNGVLWSTLLESTRLDEHQGAIISTVILLVLVILMAVLALAPGNRALKILGSTLLIVAAGCGFFMSEYGIIVDEAMIRNVAETKVREASPLLTGSFFFHLALFGVAPAIALCLLPLKRVGWRREIAARVALVGVGAIALGTTAYVNYGPVFFYGHQHHTLRLILNPIYPIYSAVHFGLGEAATPPPRAPLDAKISAAYTAARAKPRLVVFVMGETARADRFSFNGYARDTNRYTRSRGVVNFPQVASCGTSTAESVPCIFSGLGKDGFTHPEAAAHETLFGALQRLGVDAFWRDNSTGCKDICDEAHFREYATDTHPELCDATGCFDELLLENFDGLVADASRDRFVVLHLRGSHGPAYHTDVPKWIKEFEPECDLPNLRNCSLEQVNNAYDNTMLYTDYFLARVLDALEAQASVYDVAMLYVSDHGESLGENGIYLHGFPYALAPREQTHVPMLWWASPSFYAASGIDEACVRRTADAARTHDSIFHTLLPLFGVESPSYQANEDLFSACRGNGSAPPAAPPGG